MPRPTPPDPPSAPGSPDADPAPDRPLHALIIGTGFGGLGMAIALRKAGIQDFLVLEKQQDVGGVWRDNAYPGAACDVPSHLYSFSFEPKPDWSRVFAPQAEILDYLRHCARRYQLGPHLRLGCEVAAATWCEATQQWQVRLTDGRQFNSRLLISATGQLSRPALPQIEGLDEFQGPCFHSARWRHDVPLAGRRVAVIGTGASAAQFVPAIAPTVAHLDVYQRSAAWMLPRPDRAYGPLAHALLRYLPGAARALRAWTWLKYESRALAFTRWHRLMTPAGVWPFQRMLRRQVPDAARRAQLTPTDPIGCKRILLSSSYLATMSQPQVQLHTTGIRRIHAGGIETLDGQVHPADVIVLGTGFAATEFLAPMRIEGRGGQTLNQAWRDGASAWLGLGVPGFPNFFMLYGPNTNLGHNSIVYMLESQIANVMRCVRAMARQGARTVEVDAVRHAQHRQRMRQALRRTVWNGCHSWYTDAQGHNPTNWPGFTFTYRWQTRWGSLSAWRFERPRAEGASRPGVCVAPPPGRVEAVVAAGLRLFLRAAFRPWIGPPFPAPLQRAWVGLLSPLMPGVGGVRRTRQVLGGVACECVAPVAPANAHAPVSAQAPAPAQGSPSTADATPAATPVLLYLHGGAFCLGNPRSHLAISTRLARDGRFTVHVPDYRLAPEYPHPLPLADARACYEALLAQGVPASRLVLAGDSAGGALALGLALSLKRDGRPLPAALMLISPVVDSTLQTAQAAAHAGVQDPMLRMGWLRQGVAWHGAPPGCPSVDELAGLPPMLIQAGDQELLLGDAELLATRAQAAGVDCRLEVHAGRWHVFHLQAVFLASARQALRRMVGFAWAQLGG